MARREPVTSALEAWRGTRGPCVLFESTGGSGARARRSLSAVVAGGTLTFHAGGGIVADSEPGFEYAETLHKAEGLRQAIAATLE